MVRHSQYPLTTLMALLRAYPSYDRSATIRALADPSAHSEDFARPGHIFPLRYRDGGVLVRPGHTEASVDLARMAGLYPAGMVCEILNPDGTMSRLPELEEFSKKHDIRIVSIAQIIAARQRSEQLIKREAEASLPTSYGTFKVVAYTSLVEPGEHLAMVMGNWQVDEPVLVRIHSECLTGDVFSSSRCDCGDQIRTRTKHDQQKRLWHLHLPSSGRERYWSPQQNPCLLSTRHRYGHSRS